MKLPPIQYFYGNTDFSNWIASCKPFKPAISIERTYMYIQTIEISEKLKQHVEAEQKAYNDLFNLKWL